MPRHRFDPVSFIFGILFLALAGWVVGVDSPLWGFPAQWLWPAALFGGGLMLLGSVASRALSDRRSEGDDLS